MRKRLTTGLGGGGGEGLHVREREGTSRLGILAFTLLAASGWASYQGEEELSFWLGVGGGACLLLWAGPKAWRTLADPDRRTPPGPARERDMAGEAPLVTLLTTRNPIEAHLIHDQLLQAHIPCHLVDEGISYLPEAALRVMVPADRLQASHALLLESPLPDSRRGADDPAPEAAAPLIRRPWIIPAGRLLVWLILVSIIATLWATLRFLLAP